MFKNRRPCRSMSSLLPILAFLSFWVRKYEGRASFQPWIYPLIGTVSLSNAQIFSILFDSSQEHQAQYFVIPADIRAPCKTLHIDLILHSPPRFRRPLPMNLRTSYPRTLRRVMVRYRILRFLLIIFIAFNLVELHLILRRISETDIIYREQPHRQERVYIASVNWNNELILRSHWSQALVELAWKLGPENVYISIYESGSYDNTKGALMDLDVELDRLRIPRNITMSPVTHEDEMAAPPGGDGWIVTPRGKKELRRIPYLSRMRNLSLEPLHELNKLGIRFDKILFLNDVVFTVRFHIHRRGVRVRTN